jgi:hypothetical protein
VSKAASEWQTYRSRFLIQARQLSGPLVFVDALGREHRGKKGDYLVESASGAQRIWPRRLFEDAHVPLDSVGSTLSSGTAEGACAGSSAPPKKAALREIGRHLSGKSLVRPGIPAVNRLRYNM